MRTLIRNGTILTMEGPEPELVFGDLGLDGSRIAFIGSSPAGFSPERTIDAAGGVVMPGLVDAHTHIAMSLLRHYADDLPFWNWLFERVLPAEEKLCGRYVYDGSTLSLAEMIRG
ncbi:MAG TPA: amidohydrolase family protein, partial [Spirochaetales bacterium]|nr:amidohydrolase family protein [Spirochaetales bacterium]